jgi:hypothetical protein
LPLAFLEALHFFGELAAQAARFGFALHRPVRQHFNARVQARRLLLVPPGHRGLVLGFALSSVQARVGYFHFTPQVGYSQFGCAALGFEGGFGLLLENGFLFCVRGNCFLKL